MPKKQDRKLKAIIGTRTHILRTNLERSQTKHNASSESKGPNAFQDLFVL